ncbi:MAG: hypothetical protein ACTS8R_03070 [Arsenophonus sp. NC-QC1-MAG3]
MKNILLLLQLLNFRYLNLNITNSTLIWFAIAHNRYGQRMTSVDNDDVEHVIPELVLAEP